MSDIVERVGAAIVREQIGHHFPDLSADEIWARLNGVNRRSALAMARAAIEAYEAHCRERQAEFQAWMDELLANPPLPTEELKAMFAKYKKFAVLKDHPHE